jgi:hypothetical protein
VSGLGLAGFEAAREDRALWGRLVGNAVGAQLQNNLQGPPYEVTYWRERSVEVDFVVRAARKIWAIELKSGRPAPAGGLSGFLRLHPRARTLVVGIGGMSLQEFFSTEPKDLFT